jgi:hypothetical protein
MQVIDSLHLTRERSGKYGMPSAPEARQNLRCRTCGPHTNWRRAVRSRTDLLCRPRRCTQIPSGIRSAHGHTASSPETVPLHSSEPARPGLAPQRCQSDRKARQRGASASSALKHLLAISPACTVRISIALVISWRRRVLVPLRTPLRGVDWCCRARCNCQTGNGCLGRNDTAERKCRRSEHPRGCGR